MRELFTPPDAEIITFAAQDIVTTSPGNGDGDVTIPDMGETDWE